MESNYTRVYKNWIRYINTIITLFLLVRLEFQCYSRFFTPIYGEVTITGEWLQILTLTRHTWQLNSDLSLACHACCYTGHPFIMVISETRDTYTRYRVFGIGAVTFGFTCFYDLYLSRLGFELQPSASGTNALNSVAPGLWTCNLPHARRTLYLRRGQPSIKVAHACIIVMVFRFPFSGWTLIKRKILDLYLYISVSLRIKKANIHFIPCSDTNVVTIIKFSVDAKITWFFFYQWEQALLYNIDIYWINCFSRKNMRWFTERCTIIFRPPLKISTAINENPLMHIRAYS